MIFQQYSHESWLEVRHATRVFAIGIMSVAGIDVRLGQDGRVRIVVPARIASEPPQKTTMKIGTKNVELFTQEQVLTVLVNPDFDQCDVWRLGEEDNKTSFLVRSPQTFDPERSRPEDV